MESDYDLTLSQGEGEASGGTKDRFLDSLGMGERGFFDEAGEDRDPTADEGLVLSSQAEDFEFPVDAPEPARGFSLNLPESFSPPEMDGPDDGGMPEHDVKAEAAEDDLLHLQCPECEGALVLQRRHLGIEGACVWCHTAIVAAASGRDGKARVFPILGVKVAAPQVAETPPPAEAEMAEAPEMPEMPETLMIAQEEEEPPLAFSGFQMETVEETSEAAEFPSTGFAPPAATEPLDLEVLYGTGGFVPPQEEFPAPATGFGETLLHPQTEPKPVEEATSSFGFAAPVPWGPPARPAAPAPEPTPSAAATDDSAPAPLPMDFQGFAPPAPEPAAPTWETAFGAAEESSPPAASTFGVSPIDDLAPGFHAPFGTGSAPDSDEPLSDFSMQVPPSFSAPVAGKGSSASFSDPLVLPWGVSPLDEAPASLPPAVEPGPAPEPTNEPSPALSPLAGAVEQPIPLFSTEPAPLAPLLPNFSQATAGPIAETVQPSRAVEEAPAAVGADAPIVVSRPLGTKPVPKMRKGFLVLMVVILGFACGAALATYVLPVDRYIASARAWLEESLAPAMPSPEQIPALTSAPHGPVQQP